MNADPSPILEFETRCVACDVHTFLVHHRSFPELQVEGLSADEAAHHLVNRLSAVLDSARDTQERVAVQTALAEARGYLDNKGLGRQVRNPGLAEPLKDKTMISEVINIASSPAPSGSPSRLLGKGQSLEVRLLTLPQGKEIPTHTAPGEITVHCLEGRIAFTSGETTRELGAGQLLILSAGAPHSLVAHEAATVLVTKQHPEKLVNL